MNHTVTDILQGQRPVHQNLRHKQLWYTGFLVSVFLTHTHGSCQGTTGTLGDHLANTIFTSGTECSFWFAQVRGDGEGRQRLSPAALGHTPAFGCPSQSHGMLLCCEFSMCWDWDSRIKWKVCSDKGCSRLRGAQPYQFPDLYSHSSTWATHCFGFQKFQPCTMLFADVLTSGQKLLSEVGGFLIKKVTPHHQHVPPSAPLGFRRATRASHHCKALHALLFPLPLKGMRKPNQNITRKLIDRRSLVWSHCVFSRLFFGLKMLCLEESSQLKLCDSGHGMSCKAALPKPWVCRK